MRSRRVWLLMAAGALGLLLQGCDKLPYAYLGNFPPIPADTEFQTDGVVFPVQTPIAAGTVQISGQILPQAPGGLPPTLQFIVRQAQPGGAIVATVTVNVTVRPDGVIPNQLAPTPAMTIGAGEELRFVIKPIGTALPLGKVKLRVFYEKA